MMINKQSSLMILVLAIALIAAACGQVDKTTTASTAGTAAGGAKTLENLQTAFDGESNANAKYLAFAKKADEEGYAKVASLFRAAARAEEIHKDNHAQVIGKMGGVPKADVKIPEIKTTAENLKGAIEGESYERDKMYVDFLNEARTVGNKDAVRTFNFAKTAEAEHAKLYAEALANLEKWKGEKTTFFVCSTCGYTTLDGKIEKCPVDFTPKEKFEAIN
ncbi:MAG TPA: ferritin family protein [Pyrinomonadaceae bacterium]|nr:rubrerythrin [Chloracidobacterium sp.]HRJ90358.1 ferritin family protein [Pyrinomonadaceae bacterium]HRK52126.1 ferritin family protein [Pyrinomonadaceae bacterium]